jgi:biotin-(acetyl-CoA carboxylase) ligase
MKYINDVMINSEKVSGNMIQNDITGNFIKTSIGIGVNLNTDPMFYESLPQTAKANSVHNLTGIKINLEQFSSVLTFCLLQTLGDLAEGFEKLHSYAVANTSLLGKEVLVFDFSDTALANPLFSGVFEKIGKSGPNMGLGMVRLSDGSEHWL